MRETQPPADERSIAPAHAFLADGNSYLSPKSKMRSGGLITDREPAPLPLGSKRETLGRRLRWDGASCPEGTYASPPILLQTSLGLGHNADIRVGTGVCHKPNNSERPKNRIVSTIMIGKSFS